MDRALAETTDACRRNTVRKPGKQAEVRQAAKVFKALGDETRLSMLQMIAAAGELCSCELEEHFDLAQPTISHHLKLLRDAGVIEGERRGTWIHYRVVPGALHKITQHPMFEG